MGTCGGPRPFLGPKPEFVHTNRWIIIFGVSIKNSARLVKKWLSYGQQPYALTSLHMFKYGIICTFRDFLAHKLANYQYSSMKPSLFVYYYQFTYILCMFQLNISLNVYFMAIKPQKVHKIGHISVCNFYPIVITKKFHT